MESGYDSFTSLQSIDKEQISAIEEYINIIKLQGSNILNGSIYDGCDNFKFRPGHSALLLRLPTIIEQIKSQIVVKHRVNDIALNVAIVENEENLKTLLIEKITKFIRNSELQINFDQKHISEFFTDKNQVKCRVECCLCNKKYVCSYDKYWLVGNLERHFKTHRTNEENNNYTEENIPLETNEIQTTINHAYVIEYNINQECDAINTPKIIRIRNEHRNPEL